MCLMSNPLLDTMFDSGAPYLDCCSTLPESFCGSNIPGRYGWCPAPQVYLNKIIWTSIINMFQLIGSAEIKNCVFSYQGLTEQWQWILKLAANKEYMLDILSQDKICRHIEAKTKWPTFSTPHFQMHFHEWKILNWELNLNEVWLNV